MQTPTRPVAAAYPWAAWPAPCSWRTRMWRIELSMSGSYAGRMAPPGMPKTCSVPAASRRRDQALRAGHLAHLAGPSFVRVVAALPTEKTPPLRGNEGRRVG